MIRCHQCNTKLNEQTHFCNVCGLSQNPSEPALKLSAPSEQKTSDIKKPNRCDSCAAELPEEARFCAACGSAQAPHKSSVPEKTSIKRAKPSSTSENDASSNVHLQPLKSQKSAQGKQPTNEQLPKEVDTHSPIFPIQPSNNDAKSPTAIQQLNTSQNVLSSKPSTANTSNSPNPAATKETITVTPQSEISDSDQSESTSNTSTQTHLDFAKPAKMPGLIRSIAPKTSTYTVIPSRPDSADSSISMQPSEQTSQTPAYSIPVQSAKVSSFTKEQDQHHSKFSYVQPDESGQDKQQFAERATQQNQVYSQPEINRNIEQSGTQYQYVSVQQTQVISNWHDSSTAYTNGENDMSDTPKMDLLSPASFMTTSKAAERWRKSWRNRQYAEAGPAENVSRGQASVPMPLMAMQQSFVRMRAIEKTNSKQKSKNLVNFSFWITIFLMICLILGLGAYIIVSYLPNSSFEVPTITSTTNTTQPALSVVGTSSQSVKVDQSVQIRGKHFGVNQTISLLRDATTPIVDKNGSNISTQTNTQGAFEVTIPIDFHWTTGSHSIEAINKSNSQIAFLTIQVIPDATPTTTSTELSVSMDGKPSTLLKFKAIIGQANPGPQRITITNNSGKPLKWTATATSGTATSKNNLSWLMINDNNNYGELDISQPHSILISVNTVGLPKYLYAGQIIFTINNKQQLTLPVQLQIIDATPEMVFSPNPIIAQIGPGNTCQPGVSLTLINLGTDAIRWVVNPDDNIKGNIKFVSISSGQPLESGTLLPSGSQSPSGQPGDTIVLTLQCTNIKVGFHYHVSVYANQMSWSELVIVQ